MSSISLLARFLYRKLFYRRVVAYYRAQKIHRTAKLVVYSCITAGYDKPIKLYNVKADVDYVMFTDKPALYNQEDFVWEFRRLDLEGLDGARASRYPKFNPHKLLENYQESLWIDANVEIVSDTLYNDVERMRDSGVTVAIGIHPKRNCVYEEFQRCLAGSVDNRETVEKQLSILENDGYPKNNGLFENGIIYRRHNDSSIKRFDEDCWNMLIKGSRRDQLALVYCAWKNQIPIAKLNPVAYRHLKQDVIIYPHK